MANERERTASEESAATLSKRPLNSVLFNFALACAETGGLAWDEVGRTRNADFVVPAVICESFCVELLLKFFIAVSHPQAKTVAELQALGVSLHGHKYSVLYDRIPVVLRERMAASFSAVAGRGVDQAQLRAVLKDDLGDDPFVRWRYVYEDRSPRALDGDLFKLVVTALGKAAEVERREFVGRRGQDG